MTLLIPVRPRARAPRQSLARAGACAVLLALCACDRAPRNAEDAATRLMDALAAERFTAGRLSHQARWQPCPVDGDTALVPSSTCGRMPESGSRAARRLKRAERGTHEFLAADSSAVALRARGLSSLRGHAQDSAYLDAAIETLERAHARAPKDARILNDLAVAYLVLGEREQDMTPIIHALDAAERAVALDSAFLPALFNRALIRQRLYLVDGATRAWTKYQALERDPAWLAEAKKHARALTTATYVPWEALRQTPPARIDSTQKAMIATAVAASPTQAREAGFQLLGDWGRALVADSTLHAGRLLAVVREIAQAMEHDSLDAGIPRAVATVEKAARDPLRLRALARGHATFAAGVRAYGTKKYKAAARALADAERTLSASGSPAALWAAYYRAAILNSGTDYDPGDSIFRSILARTDANEPALRGQAYSALGLSQTRQGHIEAGSILYHQAAQSLEGAREKESAGRILVNISESLTVAGNPEAGRGEAFRALRVLSPVRGSGMLNNNLANVAIFARSDTLPHAALAITEENLEVARRVDNPEVLALASAAHVRDLTAVERHADADSAILEAKLWADSMEPGKPARRVLAHVHLVQSQALLTRKPADALDHAEKAVALYRGGEQEFFLPTALYQGAMAARATGDHARAEEWLREAIREIEQQRDAMTDLVGRAMFYDTVEKVFDAMIALELEAGRPQRAFEALERGRIHAWSEEGRAASTAGEGGTASLSRIREAVADSVLFVEYGVLEDRVVMWAISRNARAMETVSIPRRTLASLAAAASEGDSAALVRLHQVLLRPLKNRLRGIAQLAVVPDRELWRVPFAALIDGESGRYVVEAHSVNTLPSASFFLETSTRDARVPPEARALVVGDPLLPEGSPLKPLDVAAEEAAAVARHYPGAVSLLRPQARRGDVRRLLPSAEIFHFAGHAVFNGERPEESYLALAADSSSVSGSLYAREIAGLSLSNVRVVVLSACSSLSPRTTRTGAIPGLAYSFLRAGVPATVSTLWDVGDNEDTRELLESFHRRLAQGAHPAEALRQAQVEMLQRKRPGGARVWVAFIYTGP